MSGSNGNGRKPNGRNGKGGKNGGTPDLIPQPHGGALLSGGQPGQTPGPGRPPSRVKSALRKDFDARRDILNQIADGAVRLRLVGVCKECGHDSPEPLNDGEVLAAIIAQAPKPAERIKALEVMARFSDLEGERIDRGLIEELGNAVMAEVGDEEAVARIRERWVRIVAERIAGD